MPSAPIIHAVVCTKCLPISEMVFNGTFHCSNLECGESESVESVRAFRRALLRRCKALSHILSGKRVLTERGSRMRIGLLRSYLAAWANAIGERLVKDAGLAPMADI